MKNLDEVEIEKLREAVAKIDLDKIREKVRAQKSYCEKMPPRCPERVRW